MEPTALILDVETTGLKEPQVIEIATKGPLTWSGMADGVAITAKRFRPTKDLEPGAMATHGIIPRDLVDEPTWPGSWSPPEGTQYLIGHNVDSDYAAIGSPSGIELICTLVLAKRLWPDEASHKLSTMMYVLFEPHAARQLTADAHAAYTDVHNCSLLLDSCIYELKDRGVQVSSWADLARITADFRIPLRIGFSKYGPKNGQPGKLWSEVPIDFIHWMLNPIRVNDMDRWEVAAARQQVEIRGVR